VPRLRDRQRTLVGLRHVPFDAPVQRAEEHLDRALTGTGLGQQGGERRPAPLRRPHRLRQPGLALRARLEERAAVAGALERHGLGGTVALLQVIEGESDRALDRPTDLQAEAVRVHRGDVVVDEEVVEPRRRDVVPQRLERKRVVARREPELVLTDALVGGRAGRREVHARESTPARPAREESAR
jgi:hypothetical protein